MYRKAFIISIIAIFLLNPMIALSDLGEGKKLSASNGVTAYRYNQYEQGRVIITYTINNPSASYLEVRVMHHNDDRRYRFGVPSGEVHLTEKKRYTLRFYDSSGNRIASIITIDLTLSPLQNESTMPYPVYDGSGDLEHIEIVDSTAYYAAYRDEYRMDYQIPSGSVTKYVLEYMGADDEGSIYTREYNDPPSGIHYLTCNGGYYTIYFYNGDRVIAETNPHYVDGIFYPTCSSYPDSGIIDDLGANYTPGEGLSWSGINGAVYEIWKEGSLIGVTQDTYYPADPGSYTIIAKDQYGNTIGQSDINTNLYQPSPPGGECDVCDRISRIIQCPGWDEYVGSWASAIGAVIPKPKEFMDEFMNRLPTISDTIANDIADELEKREKTVSPPPPTPQPFNPDVPNINDYDMPEAINEDLLNNIPDFTPDFSASKPFELLDPAKYENYFDMEDIGYMELDPVVDNREYKGIMNPDIEPDRGYNPPGINIDQGDIPVYSLPPKFGGEELPTYTPPIATDPEEIPEYKLPDDEKMPEYQAPGLFEPGMSPIYNPDLSIFLGGEGK